MRRFLLYVLLLTVMCSCCNDIVIDEKWLEDNYSKTEAMVTMRDGVKLYTSVYQPVDSDDRPVLLVRTPYSCAPYGDGWLRIELRSHNSGGDQ